MKKEELLELNKICRKLKRLGKYEEIKKILKDKEVDNNTINQFLTGDILFITEEIKKAETSKQIESMEINRESVINDIIIPFYKNIEEKLNAEKEDLLQKVENKKEKEIIEKQLKPVLEHILKSEAIKSKAFENWKELNRCWVYMTNKAKEYAINGIACIADDTVYGWIDEYYSLDDREKVEEERIKEAIQKKMREETAKKAATPKKTTRKRKTKAEKEAEEKAKEEAKAKESAKTDNDEAIELVSEVNNKEVNNKHEASVETANTENTENTSSN